MTRTSRVSPTCAGSTRSHSQKGEARAPSLRAREGLHERRVFVFQLRVAGGGGVEDQEGDHAVALDRRHLALALRSRLALAELLALAARQQRRQALQLRVGKHVARAL